MVNKKSELTALKSRYNIIRARGKTAEGQGVLRKLVRKIRNLEKE